MMVFLSLLPAGPVPDLCELHRDYAYARSAEVIHGPVMQALVWARVPGDLVFSRRRRSRSRLSSLRAFVSRHAERAPAAPPQIRSASAALRK